MSQVNGSSPDPRDQRDQRDPGTILAPAQRRGRRGVTLRSQGDGAKSVAEMLDPASKSLADALRIMYRLLLVGMVVIVAVYFLSGFKRVNETESGVRTVLGKITSSDIPPGFAPSFPEPIGELIRVQTGEQSLALHREFFFRVSDSEEQLVADKGLQALADGGNNAIDPDSEGALITADGNLVHSRVLLTYQRTGASKNLLNIANDDGTGAIEREIVRAAARRGMVHAASRTTADEFLRNQTNAGRSDGETRSVERIARDSAQEFLNSLNSGIEIKTFSLKFATPPRFLMRTFNEVQAAQSTASNEVDRSEAARKERLNQAAGEAAELLLSQIEAYDRATTLGDSAKAGATLDVIHKIMMREPVNINGETIQPNTFGNVSTVISGAQRYRTEVVGEAQSDASLFKAKQAAFKSNPDVMVSSEWAHALQAFLSRDSVQTMILPPSSDRVVVQINRDPAILREQEQERQTREAKAAADKREAERKRAVSESKLDGTGVGN